jgi:hypothetical protein
MLLKFEAWLKEEHGKELPLPKALQGFDTKVYSKGVRILKRDDIP